MKLDVLPGLSGQKVILNGDYRTFIPAEEKVDGLTGVIIGAIDEVPVARVNNGDYIEGHSTEFLSPGEQPFSLEGSGIIGAIIEAQAAMRAGVRNLELTLGQIYHDRDSDPDEEVHEVRRFTSHLAHIPGPYHLHRPIPVMVVEFIEDGETLFDVYNPTLHGLGLIVADCGPSWNTQLELYGHVINDILTDKWEYVDFPTIHALRDQYVSLPEGFDLERYRASHARRGTKAAEAASRTEVFSETIPVPDFVRGFRVTVYDRPGQYMAGMHFAEGKVYVEGDDVEHCRNLFAQAVMLQMDDLRKADRRTPEQSEKLRLLASYKQDIV